MKKLSQGALLAILLTSHASAQSGVTSFNTRTGAVTLNSGDVTTSLGYTPANNTLTPTGGSNASTLPNILGARILSATDFGVICDAAAHTGNTAAFQNAINSAESTGQILWLPYQLCVIGPVDATNQIKITGPITIIGGGSQSGIVLASASTKPALTISIPFYSNQDFANVTFTGFRITSPDRSDISGQSVAHAIALVDAATPQVTQVNLNNMDLGGVPGDDLNATGFHGYVVWTGSRCLYPGGNGIYANSVTDWQINGGGCGGALGSNVIFSGTFGMMVNNFAEYTSTGPGWILYNADQTWINNTQIDESANDAMQITLSAGQVVNVNNSFIRCGNYIGTSGTYQNLHIMSGNAGVINLYDDAFTATSGCGAIATAQPAYNIKNDSSAPVFTTDVTYASGSSVSGITNQPTLVQQNINQGIENCTAVTCNFNNSVILNSQTQFTGYSLKTGSNIAAALFGVSATNDGGTLQLSLAGTPYVSLSASSPNYINQNVFLGNGATAAAPVGKALLATGGSGTNVAGAALVLAGGLSTGSANGGSIHLQVSPAGASGSSANALADAIVIDSTKNATFSGMLKFASSTIGSATETLTNSPCGSPTVPRWIPVAITGQTGTWYVAACQ